MHLKLRQRRKQEKAYPKKTFKTILDQTRVSSARAAWMKARTASVVRHHTKRISQTGSARALSDMKVKSICLAFELAPELMKIEIDDLQSDLLSIRFADGSRLHLPAVSRNCSWRLTNNSQSPDFTFITAA